MIISIILLLILVSLIGINVQLHELIRIKKKQDDPKLSELSAELKKPTDDLKDALNNQIQKEKPNA